MPMASDVVRVTSTGSDAPLYSAEVEARPVPPKGRTSSVSFRHHEVELGPRDSETPKLPPLPSSRQTTPNPQTENDPQ